MEQSMLLTDMLARNIKDFVRFSLACGDTKEEVIEKLTDVIYKVDDMEETLCFLSRDQVKGMVLEGAQKAGFFLPAGVNGSISAS